VKFKKGDTVIYPQHGACIVHGIKRMKAFGATQEYLILKTVINEMTLSVPTAMANQVGVRPPVSKSELEDLRSVLSKADPRVPANWSRRFKNHQEKLKSGDVYQVAEVVRNLAARDRDSSLWPLLSFATPSSSASPMFLAQSSPAPLCSLPTTPSSAPYKPFVNYVVAVGA
jgi:CarD family transcriptional regulator